MSEQKNKLNYNVFFLTLGVFIFILGVGFILNDISLKEGGRGLASQNKSPEDNELIQIATKKIIQKVNLSKNLDFGGDPTELEEFVYGELKGQYRVFNEDKTTLKIIKVGEDGVTVKDFKKFTLSVMKVLNLDSQEVSLVESSRDLASARKGSIGFTVESKSAKEKLAEVSIELNDSSKLEALTVKKIK